MDKSQEISVQNNNQPRQSSGQLPSQIRENPNLLRVYADDQDKKTVCCFWVALATIVIIIGALASFAVPKIYVKNPQSQVLRRSDLSTCPNPSTFSANQLICTSMNSLKYGQVVNGWNHVNQFALSYLQIIPDKMPRSISIQQKITFQLIDLNTIKNSQGLESFVKAKEGQKFSWFIDFQTSEDNYLFEGKDQSAIGYSYPLAIITDLQDRPFVNIIEFQKSLNLTGVTIHLQSYTINKQFTIYTIVLRYIFFALSIIACFLYLRRYIQIPQDKRIIEQKFIAAASIVLIFFNDPFYPLTVLKPNGASAFFSVLFVANMIAFLMLLWLVFFDRIYFEEGKKQTVEFTKKKITYTFILWTVLTICLMAYTMQQIQNAPIVSNKFQNRYKIAKVVIGILIFLGVAYIAMRLVKSCISPEGKSWRSSLFMAFSSVFIFAVFIIVVSNSLVLFNYEGQQIFLVYSLINLYIYYIQYMFTITTDQLIKLSVPDEQAHNYDTLTVGTIQLVDVNLDDDDDFNKKSEKKNQKGDQISDFEVD